MAHSRVGLRTELPQRNNFGEVTTDQVGAETPNQSRLARFRSHCRILASRALAQVVGERPKSKEFVLKRDAQGKLEVIDPDQQEPVDLDDLSANDKSALADKLFNELPIEIRDPISRGGAYVVWSSMSERPTTFDLMRLGTEDRDKYEMVLRLAREIRDIRRSSADD